MAQPQPGFRRAINSNNPLPPPRSLQPAPFPRQYSQPQPAIPRQYSNPPPAYQADRAAATTASLLQGRQAGRGAAAIIADARRQLERVRHFRHFVARFSAPFRSFIQSFSAPFFGNFRGVSFTHFRSALFAGAREPPARERRVAAGVILLNVCNCFAKELFQFLLSSCSIFAHFTPFLASGVRPAPKG